MSKHTPGPWQRNIRCGGKYPTIFSGRNKHVAVAKPQARPEETEANIDLIAAAPELLEALRILVACTSPLPGTHGLAIDNAKAAIAKATGAA